MIRGGLRTRLIADSVRLTLIAGLTGLGWFDATVHDDPPGVRRHRPVRYMPRPLKWDQFVEPNAIAISTEDTRSEPQGLGGEVLDDIRMYADIFAESDELGWQVAQDIRDLLLGKMPYLGRVAPVIDVYDLRQATPAPFTQLEVVRVFIDRAESESREWRNRWFMVRFDVLDEYYDESGPVDLDAPWQPTFGPVWQQIQQIETSR